MRSDNPAKFICSTHQMYNRRIKIFLGISGFVLLVCLARLAQMQLLSGSSVQDEIARLKQFGNKTQQLKTVRGSILDRTGRVLAVDQPEFFVCINYEYASILDERVRKAELLKAATKPQLAGMTSPVLQKRKAIDDALEDLQQSISKCIRFGVERQQMEEEIRNINDRIWSLRCFLAWRRQFLTPELKARYGDKIVDIPFKVAMEDFASKAPSEDRRIMLAYDVNTPDMHKLYPLFELKNDDDVFTAQVEFIDVDGIQIQAEAKRYYPYGSTAAQTIGWVGPATQQQDKGMFESDRLASYLTGEVCGREDGVEYVCEAVLRGRRGELVHDIDEQLVRQTETQLGNEVQLTIDIELQGRIEQYLADYKHAPGCGPGMAAVVIEVASCDILALVSLPSYDLNAARDQYDVLIADPNSPLANRAINQWYPPGSVIKPVTLIAGLESGSARADETISCPAQESPRYWPNCWLFNQYRIGHDGQWTNNARNAIKGSCNIYFSHIADRIEPRLLQQWLFGFGYGRGLLLCPAATAHTDFARELRQLAGMISSTVPKDPVSTFEEIPPLDKAERRWFGMGQGKLLVTPVQVANAMATIARGGVFHFPRLFADDPNAAESEGTNLGISQQTMNTVFDGMSAVVNEQGGTAYKVFESALGTLAKHDVKVYGKTGSTQPAHAWFGGFATDGAGRKIALAVVVEGGQHGASDAAPLGRDIIQFCIEAGYLGRSGADSN